MLSTRLLLFLGPVTLYGAWLAWRAALGRRPTRFIVSTSLSLVLLLYFVAVVGTGIFWVAAQELPVLDWHYLPGYVLLSLATVHVALHWRPVAALLRRVAPASVLAPGRGAFRGWVRAGFALLLAGAAGAAVFAAGMRHGAREVTIVTRAGGDARAGDGAAAMLGALVPATAVEAGGKRTTLARLYHDGSSYPARAALPGLTLGARPAVYNERPGAREVALPEVRSEGGGGVVEAHRAWVEGTPAGEAVELTLDRLSSLLFHAQGITGRMERRSLVFELRAAPSAGALYPTNVYVLARKVPGLAPGLYLYHPKRAALLEVSSDPMLPDHLALATGGSKLVGEAPATVLFSVTFGRTAFKYRERAYRYVGMDTGHAAYNLGVAAAAAGLWAPMLARFDDGAVNAALALDPRTEAAFLIMPLVPQRTAKAAALAGPRFERERASAGGAAFVELVHGGTSLRRSGDGVEVRRHPSHLEAAEGDLVLPAPAEGRPLLPSIHDRRSSRDYTAAPIRLEELSALCLAAAGEGETVADPLLATSAPLGLYLVVRHVEGLGAGIYRYVPASHALRRIKDGDYSATCESASLQQEFCGTADVVFVKTVAWRDLLVPDGDRGYRYACLRAGVAGEGLYLAGSALGIGVCGVGAFEDPDVGALLGLDPNEEVPLYLTAAGK